MSLLLVIVFLHLHQLSMFVFLTLTQQECKTGTTHLAPGMQVPPQATSDHDGDQFSGPTAEQPHFHRAQSVTSAVDYEYFDVGIGQVAHMLRGSV